MTTMQPARALRGTSSFVVRAARRRASDGHKPEIHHSARTVEHLTDRENNVLECLGSGLSNRQIASQLHVSEDTVKYHLKNIYGKIGVHSRTHAVLVAQRVGLLAPDRGWAHV